MNENYSIHLSSIVEKFRSDLAIDMFECRDFSLAVYFFSYVFIKELRESSVEDRRLSGFEKYIHSVGGEGYSELSAYASIIDESLGYEFFLNDVVTSFFRRSFGARAGEDIRAFCRRILEFVSLEDVFLSAGDYFELLIKVFSEGLGKRAGEDYTRRSLVELMVSIVQPKGGESIYDPVCGSGGFLVAASRYSLAHGDGKQLFLNGRETSFSSSRLAKMNCYLHGYSNFNIKTECSLQSVDPNSFDVVLANPPFSMPLPESALSSGSMLFEFGVPPKSNADYAFLQVIVKSLKPTGRAAVVVSQGVLFRAGVEAEIRRSMILAGLIDAVISLPSNMLIGTSIPISILVLRGAHAQRKEILFIDAAAAYEKMKKDGATIKSVEAAILDVYKRPRDIEGASILVKISALEKNNYNLNLSRYITPLVSEEKSFDDLLDEQLALDTKLDSLQKEFYQILERLRH